MCVNSVDAVCVLRNVSVIMCCTGVDGGQDKHFTDRDICRPFLLDICISDLFTNTVSDGRG